MLPIHCLKTRFGPEQRADSPSASLRSSSASAAPVASTSAAPDAFATPAPAPRAPPSAPTKALGSQAQMAQLADILAGISGGAPGSTIASDVPGEALRSIEMTAR